MKAEIKVAWTAALRSGEYQQGRYHLRDGDYFCCLGVLCELAKEAGVVQTWVNADGITQYNEQTDLLPREVVEWAGLDSEAPTVTALYGNQSELFPGNQIYNLPGLNDDLHLTFETIADIIDAEF